MATWRSLGIITPIAFEWQTFPTSSDRNVFRLTFRGDLGRVWYYARVRQHFSSSEVGLSQKIYPKAEKLIIEMSVPTSLRMTQTQRLIGIAKFPYRRWTVIDSDWSVQLEELVM